MKFLSCIFGAAFLQITTAQILSHMPRNAPGQFMNQPLPNTYYPTQQVPNANPNTLRTVPNNGIPNMVQNIPNNVPLNGNLNAFNGAPHLTNNLAHAPIANVMNDQAVIANPTIGGIITNPEISNAQIGVVNPDIATLANMANINGNMATFNLGNGGFTVTSGSPGTPGFGIQVMADALEVGGRVAVNGQIPIFGTVTLNGHLPTDGSAAVNYNCGRETAPADVILN